ncbi:hypothetical protein EO98_18880 [Methanosarcina sp. 2.H.T.1A.6]|nr:hypothetical protein EO94_18010 [Methanosarcina sp. 2.H.T.1A.3]KKG20387.1 hypothetical protein EO98_18880 [Methanosarcina sp. 2.H.T.1A.6]KKG23348.1 hypothetical protein EO96_16975 [Methanosarcina sp. 2.H.T.1A.8]KKG27760.1 hypothetical protein EO97_00835 [Methanosarcina sp. 2.H.T.1A.15]
MLVVPLLNKYKKYLMWSYRTLGFLQIAGKYSFLFLLMILFNLYELAYYVPGVDKLSKFQVYLGTYWFNLGLMAAGAMVLIFLTGLISRLFNRRTKFNLINLLETSFPELKTRLSTAYDNSQNINIVTKKLLEDVHSQLTGIKIKKIVPKNQIFRSFIIFLLAAGAVTFCIHEGFSFDISPGQLIDDLRDNISNMNARAAYEKNEDVVPDSRYKIKAVIIKNGDQVEMKINPSLGLGFTSQIDADTEKNFNESSDSFNEEFKQSQTYSENLPEEYEPLIKQYFEALSS